MRYLDGGRLLRSAAAAARWVSQRQENLNGINVFPVPDGDTGTNLAATLVSAVDRARRVRERGLDRVSRALAEGALFGACGNSGAILAQFFDGFAGAVEGRERASGDRLAAAITSASAAAERALSQPREGTILTVMRAWAERFAARSAAGGADLIEPFRDALAAAREALARTPGQLRELARAGVVDAGAQGFVYFLEGILHFADGRLAGTVLERADHAAPLPRASVAHDGGSIAFGFCTECLIEGEALDLVAIRAAIGHFGDSLVVAGSPRCVRVHVHTEEPEAVFEATRRLGRLTRVKADDMRAQHAARFGRRGVVIVTDTAADLPEADLQRLRIHTVPLRVIVGSAVYLDKQTLAPDEVYERLRRGERSVRTSQPPAGDYLALYRYLFEHYAAIVVPSLSSALSGTAAAARRAAALVDGERIRVVDTGTASIAQGLIVRAAAERAAAGDSVGEIVKAVEDARSRVRLFIAVPTIEYLERGGRVGGWKTSLARRLGLVPVLTLPADRGTPRLAGVARRGEAHRKTLATARRALEREMRAPERVWVAHAGVPRAADAFRAALRDSAPEAEIEVLEVGPVLGAHAGPGAVAVAWLSPSAP
ncbi:MAG TPA: DegV family protein [Gemmatimonadota bacterium]|nr:DegV family protein [Gemmatimonadota bacterium]